MPTLIDEFPRIEETIRLSEYAEAFEGAEVKVWVNVPRQMIVEMGALADAGPGPVYAWLARVWNWDAADVQALAERCADQDPGLWNWLTGETGRQLRDYRAGVKKNSRPESSD